MAGLVWLGGWVLPTAWPAPLRLFSQVAFGIVVYVALVWNFAKADVIELWRSLRAASVA